MRTCLLVLAAGCASDLVRDYDGHVPAASPDTAFAAIVVDAAAGRPLPGASVRLYQEDTEPTGIPGKLVLETFTDEHGVVSFPWREEYAGCHFVFEAIGCAPYVHFGAPEDRVELLPGRTWRGQLLDPQGEPAAGVAVEYYCGCPHAPALRRATTDAQGRFVLWNIGDTSDVYLDGFFWAPAPGAAARSRSPRELPVEGSVLEPIRGEPGVTVTGTVYDDAGLPAKGVVVYSTQEERGPKVRTADDGTFTLTGVAPDEEVRFGLPGARAEMARTAPMEPPPPPAPPPPSTVRVRAPDALYHSFSIGGEDPVDPDEGGRVDLKTTLRGRVRIDFIHETHGDGEIIVDIEGAVVEVPPTAFRVPGFLAFPKDAEVSVFDDEGGWGAEGPTSWRYRHGAIVRIARDGHATNYRSLSGRGPYAVRPGSATLDIRTGDLKGAVCWVDGERFAPGLVRGLDAGPHTVLVGAPGHVGQVAQVVLSEGEARQLDVRLKKP